jgi:hypothetical protein
MGSNWLWSAKSHFCPSSSKNTSIKQIAERPNYRDSQKGQGEGLGHPFLSAGILLTLH